LGPILFIILMAGLPRALGIKENELCGYADDVCLWASGPDAQCVQQKLNLHVTNLITFANSNALALNPEKTQLLITGKGSSKHQKTFSVSVGHMKIQPKDTLDLLGVSFDNRLSLTPFLCSTAKSAKQLAAIVSRLSHHLPRGPFLSLLAKGLVLGKVTYAIAATAHVKLDEKESQHNSPIKTIQIALNDVARSLTGFKRSDQVPTEILLKKAGIPSYNTLAVQAIAMETWKAYHSNDGPDKTMNPLGNILFGSTPSKNISTRACTQGLIGPALPMAADTMVNHAVKIWNSRQDLRTARNLAQAKSVARSLSRAITL